MINLTMSAAAVLAVDRIRVNAICPGAIPTPLMLGRLDPEIAKERLAGAQPWPDTGCPEFIAGAALFLASDDAVFVTGQALSVDGGLTIQLPQIDIFQRTGPQAVGVGRGSTVRPRSSGSGCQSRPTPSPSSPG